MPQAEVSFVNCRPKLQAKWYFTTGVTSPLQCVRSTESNETPEWKDLNFTGYEFLLFRLHPSRPVLQGKALRIDKA